MTERMDIFVGADRSQLLAVAVLDHSIRRHTRRPVRVQPLIDLDLPEPKDLLQGSRTNFSFARFAIPELTGYRGKALYLDADMLVFRDIGELWDLPFDGAKILIQEEIPDHLAAPDKAGAPKTRVKQCAVMLIDCERTDWDVRKIVAGLDGDYDYAQLMYQMCILPEEEVGYRVPFAWNSLEHHDLETRLIHYTDMNTQPWVSPDNPFGHLWFKEVLVMLENGSLTMADLEREIALGYFRPSLALEINDMPHEAGFDPDAAARYGAFDREAKFIKHAEVYARKRARDKLIKARG